MGCGEMVTKRGAGVILECPGTKNVRFRVIRPGFLVITIYLLESHFTP